MSVFANALESADAETQEQQTQAAQVPEEETATAAVADTADEANQVAQESADAEQLGDEQEQLEDVNETIANESAGLTAEAARYLSLSLRRIVGKNHANKIVALENYSSGRSAQMEAKRIAMEGIKETLKTFWAAIKAQLKKFYAKVKSFFIKAFSSAKKLSARAKKIQNRAAETVGSIDEKSFSFSQTKAIAVAGKYNDVGVVLGGLQNIRTSVEGTITVKKSDDYETVITEAQALVEGAIKKYISLAKTNRGKFDNLAREFNTDATSVVKKLAEVNSKTVMVGSTQPEEKLAKMYSDKVTEVKMSDPLPGGKAIFNITISRGLTELGLEKLTAVSKAVKNSRSLIGSDKYTSRDVTEGDVKTLTTSQIDKVCDDVIEIAEIAYTYEKAWDRRDKFQAKLEREIDQIVKDVDQEDDENIDNAFQRAVRSYAESFTASVRRRTTFESQLISYSLTTANAFLNYAEKSLAQHKSK